VMMTCLERACVRQTTSTGRKKQRSHTKTDPRGTQQKEACFDFGECLGYLDIFQLISHQHLYHSM
jgi:hypothetical protein